MSTNTFSLKVVSVISAFVLLLIVHAAAQAQVVNDPGFEAPGTTLVSTSDAPSGKAQISGTVADGWIDNTNWADVEIKYSLDSANPHTGNFSQRIEVGRGFSQFGQPMAFDAGLHRVSVWMRADRAQWVSISLRQAGAPYISYAQTTDKIGKAWTQLTAEGDTPNVAGLLLVHAAGPGVVWVDDAQLTPLKSLPPVRIEPPTTTVTRAFFGLNINNMHSSPGYEWPVLDFGGFRTWDSGDVWANVEPQRGVYNWVNMDKDIAEAHAHHMMVLFTLGVTPLWASSQPDTPAVYGIGSGAPPANIDDWRTFIGAVATRYKGRIGAYEVWNEPDLAEFYTGKPEQLVPLEVAMARVVHNIDPSALVVSPPVSGGGGISTLQFMDAFLSAGGGRYADVIAYHGYNYPAEADIPAVRALRALLASDGVVGKPLWDTETGTDLSATSEADTAAFVPRVYLTDWAIGVHRLFLYAYDGSFTGLDKSLGGGKRDSATLGPTGVAYQQIESWLIGARMTSYGNDGGFVWTVGLRRADGTKAYIVWNSERISTFTVPAAWHVTREVGIDGVSAPISGNTASIGPAPHLLEQ